MKKFSKTATKFLFALATSLMLISCGGSNSGSESSNQVIKPIPNAKVVYVCADGKADANGSSWEDCKPKIQDAITKAQNDSKDLWFLAGEYILNETIILDKDTKLYGGFKGTENELSDRKLDTNATVLSGNKKIRVLKTENLSDKSVLDGFVITRGKLTNFNEYGAGMLNTKSDITISNTTFSKNVAEYEGGAIYNKNSSPRLTNVSFINNSSDSSDSSASGCAIYNNHSSPTIINASFSQNKAYGSGVIDNLDSHPKITNATFSQNEIGHAIIHNTNSNPTFTNITFVKNKASYTIHNADSNPTIKNSILWGNRSNEIFNDSSTPTINNSIIKGDSGHNGSQDPLLSEAKTKIINGVKHTYYDLEANSPAINAGNNDDNNETTDQVGNNRKNGTIDIGAIEKQ